MATARAEQRPEEQEGDVYALILAEAIEHGVEVQRFTAGLLALIFATWRPYRSRLVGDLLTDAEGIANRGDRATRQKNYRRLVERARKTIAEGVDAIRRTLMPQLRELAKIEAAWTADTFADILEPQFQLGRLHPSSAEAIVRQRKVWGKDLAEWLKELQAKTSADVEQAITLGFTEGESAEEIAQRLVDKSNGRLKPADTEIEKIVTTAAHGVSENARQAVYEENRSVFDESEWTAVLDDHTCQTCAALDGQRWLIDEGPRSPIHPRCRCSRLPVIPGASGGTRATMDGPVYGETTFADWLATQSAEVQERILGVTRAKLFREGKLDGLNPKLMLDANHRPVNLTELRRRIANRSRRTQR